MKTLYRVLNIVLSLWVLAIGAIFLTLDNAAGYFVAVVALVVAGFIPTRKMWTYFAAGVIGVATFQLAKLGFEFAYDPHRVMMFGALLIPFAIFLSIKLGRAETQDSQS